MGVSIRDVADRAEVSLGTVSNALNRPERVAPATLERVRAAITELGFIRNEAARQLRVTRQTLHRILSGKAGVSAEMAVRLGRFCGNGPGLWLRMQQSFDLWHAEQRLSGELKKIPAHLVR